MWEIEENRDAVPAELDTMQPGMRLAKLLERLDACELSGHDRVRVLRARQRLIGWQQARLYADMAALADEFENAEDPLEATTAEIGAALHLTRMAAGMELHTALRLRHRLPHVWSLLALGVIDVRRARALVDGTDHLPDDVARQVVDQVADRAGGWTTGQIRARLRKLCIEADPEDAARRYTRAFRDRRLTAEPTPAGTVDLMGLDLPPDRVSEITDRINRIARSLCGGDEARTMDQLRADVFLDLLDGSARHDGKGGVVDIRVDLATLARLAEHPGDVNGYGPVVADIARRIAEDRPGAEWRWTATDPSSGEPQYQGVTRRRPTAAMRHAVEARDRTCVFPGCRHPASDADLDHGVPWADGGPTSAANLAPLCRYHHTRRHQDGWTYQRLPNGDYVWTSPLGHPHTTSGVPP